MAGFINGVRFIQPGDPYNIPYDSWQHAITDAQQAKDEAALAVIQAGEYTDAAVNPILNFLTQPLADDEIATVSHPSYALPAVDSDGHIAGGWLQDGTHNTEKPPRVMGATGVSAQPVIAPGWAFLYTDAAGRVAFGVRDDGTFVAHKGSGALVDPVGIANVAIGLTRSKRDAIVTVGDSLTYGYFDGSPGPVADSYPAHLATLLPAVTVTNAAMSGFTVDEAAIRLGALAPALTVAGGTIPASGPVTVTTPDVIGWRSADRVVSFAGSLAGVPGVLARAADGNLTFTRNATGSATPVPAGTPWVASFADHHADTTIIMIGRNDVGFGSTVPGKSVAEHTVEGIARIVDWHSRGLAQVLVMSVTTTTNETSGTAGYATVQAINDALATRYTTRYFDLRHYLVTQAIYDLGITPTAADLTAMAGDTLPPSIMDGGTDPTHYSRATADLVAVQVHEYLTTRDWTVA